MDRSLLGSSVHGILQARILEWAAVPSFRDLPNPGISLRLFHLLPWLASSLPLAPPGKPLSSLTRKKTCAPHLESMDRWTINRWTAREVPSVSQTYRTTTPF